MAEKNDDRWLESLASQAREQIEAEDRGQFDSRWDDYTAGRLDKVQVKALLAESNDADSRLAATLFKPLDEDFKATLLRRAQEQSSVSHPAQEGEAGVQDSTEPSENVGGFRDFFNWLMFAHNPGYQWALGAAGVVLIGLGFLPALLEEEPIPAFSLRAQGIQQQRSGEADSEIFQSGQRFEFRLQPETPVQGRVAVTIFVQPEGGDIQRWQEAETAARTYPDGTVLTTDLEWSWGAGKWSVYFLIGRDYPQEHESRRLLAELSSPQSGSLENRALENDDWRLMIQSINVEP